MKDIIYDHYIAIDWSIINMAIDSMTKKSNKITAMDRLNNRPRKTLGFKTPNEVSFRVFTQQTA